MEPFQWLNRFWYSDDNFFSLAAVAISFVVTLPGLLTYYFVGRYKRQPQPFISFARLSGIHAITHVALFFVIRFDGQHHLLLNWFHVSLTPFALFMCSYSLLCGIGIVRELATKRPS